MAVYAIGDVQGCYDALRRLLDRLDFDERRDTLWLAGDIVSRGPRSLKTLRFVQSLGDAAITVLGNHDINLIDCAWNARAPRPNDRLAAVLAASDGDELIDWLARRPFAHIDRERRAVLVHAGVPPGWTRAQFVRRAARLGERWRRELADNLRAPPPTVWRKNLARREKLRYTLSALTRMRYCAPDGALLFAAKGHPAQYGKDTRPWYEFLHRDWDGHQVYFGHWSTLGDAPSRHVTSLDTGCVWGRQLTAVKVPRRPRNLIEYECVSCAKRR